MKIRIVIILLILIFSIFLFFYFENKDDIYNESINIKKEIFESDKKELEKIILENKEVSFENTKIVLYSVQEIIDGDTVKILINGKIENIRIIGINTPEIGKRLECFGNEAKKKAIELLSGKKVAVEFDDTKNRRDKHNRLLAYLIIEGKVDFGEQMIKQGYAYEYTHNLPYQNQKKYQLAEKYARENQRGLWSKNSCLEFYQNKNIKNNIFNTGNLKLNENCFIKGNISFRNDEKIYHLPGQEFYSRTRINLAYGEQ